MITDLKDLEKLLKLCRKYGLADMECGTSSGVFKAKFGEQPNRRQESDDDEEPMIAGSDKFILEQLGIAT